MRILKLLIAFAGLSIGATAAQAEWRGFATTDVNMRAGPSTGFSIVDVVPRGADVFVDFCQGGWCAVEYRGDEGFISDRYLERARVREYEPRVEVLPPVLVDPGYEQRRARRERRGYRRGLNRQRRARANTEYRIREERRSRRAREERRNRQIREERRVRPERQAGEERRRRANRNRHPRQTVPEGNPDGGPVIQVERRQNRSGNRQRGNRDNGNRRVERRQNNERRRRNNNEVVRRPNRTIATARPNPGFSERAQCGDGASCDNGNGLNVFSGK